MTRRKRWIVSLFQILISRHNINIAADTHTHYLLITKLFAPDFLQNYFTQSTLMMNVGGGESAVCAAVSAGVHPVSVRAPLTQLSDGPSSAHSAPPSLATLSIFATCSSFTRLSCYNVSASRHFAILTWAGHHHLIRHNINYIFIALAKYFMATSHSPDTAHTAHLISQVCSYLQISSWLCHS